MNSSSTGPHSLDSCEIGNATPETSPVSPHRHSVPNIHDESEPVKLSSYVVDPSAAYENKSNWKSTAYASTKLAIDIVKESSDVFTPLKSVAGGLSAVLKHYDVQYAYPATLCTSLTVVISKQWRTAKRWSH